MKRYLCAIVLLLEGVKNIVSVYIVNILHMCFG